LDFGQIRFHFPQPSYLDSLHIFSLNIAAIKTSKPADNILQLITSLLSLESASFKSGEEIRESSGTDSRGIISIPNTRWTDNLLVESILAPTNLIIDIQFEVNAKNISVVVETLSFAISKHVYHLMMNLITWSNSFISTMYTFAQILLSLLLTLYYRNSPSSTADSVPTQALQVTALLGIVEVVIKSHTDTETFDLLLAAENISSSYSVLPGKVEIFDNKIGSVLVKSTHGIAGVSASRNMLIPLPAAVRGTIFHLFFVNCI
jgi:hypothetical protein